MRIFLNNSVYLSFSSSVFVVEVLSLISSIFESSFKASNIKCYIKWALNNNYRVDWLSLNTTLCYVPLVWTDNS